MKNFNNIINVFKPRFRSNEVLTNNKDILNGWTGVGNETDVFEKEWEKYTKLKNSLFLNSATAGLHVSVGVKKFYGWKDQSEVITTPISFVSTAHCIIYSKLKPVFCDIDITGTLDPKNVKFNKS